MFHEFFGENMLRADVCNAVEELGQLLDHTGPVYDAERNAARIFSADHMYFVTNGTSTSNKIVWSAMVSPGDIVVVDRNCHKSVLHALILTGAIPIFLTPTRNQIGIIGPIPRREFDPDSIRAKIEANPFVRDKTATPRLLTLTQSTYDGIVYNVEKIKASLDGHVDALHFDEAWLPHAAFHDFYHQMHAIGPGRPRCATSLVVATQSTHKLLAGLSQASQILVQDSDRTPLDEQVFNEAFLMHTSTSPQYAIIASCDVAAAMMERPGGTALVEESLDRGAGVPPGHDQDRRGDARHLVVLGLGTGHPGPAGPRGPPRLGSSPSRQLARLLRRRARLHHARPDQGHHPHARPRRRRNLRRDRHPGRRPHPLPRRARHRGGEDRALLVLHPLHHRHHQGPLEHPDQPAAAVQGRLRRQPPGAAGHAALRRRLSRLRRHRPA